MTDEKPKHKPQQKHTLSEVLKSLQDLIRTDLVPGRTTAQPGSAEPPTAAAPASSEPDSFDEALLNLDRMITERIIEPVERAREEPPEPLLPDEILEIEWDDSHASESPGDETAEPASAPNDLTSADETIELEALVEETEPPFTRDVEPGASDNRGVEAPSGAAAENIAPEELPEQTIELSDTEPAAEADGQHTFEFTDSPAAATEELMATPADDASVADADIFVLEGAADTHPKAEDETRADLPGAALEIEPPGQPLSEESEHRPDEARAPEAIPTLTVEYTETMVDAATPPGEMAPPAQEATGTNDASHTAEEPPVKTEPKPPERAPETGPPVSSTPQDPRSGADGEQTPAAPLQPGASADEPIPVLKEVADLNAPPAPPLPDAAQARDIAIRVIAKLNIERRKTGEAPLDIKTIERLQQYLADALTKRALNKPK